MKTHLLILLAVTTLCAAPTCGQIEVPQAPKPKPVEQEPLSHPDTPDDLSAVTIVSQERDMLMHQIHTLLATFCMDASADKWAVDMRCVTRGLNCLMRMPNNIYSNGAEVLSCAIDARKQPSEGEEK